MTEDNIFVEIIKYGSYVVIGLFGWLFRRHVEKAEAKELEQDSKLGVLDRRLDGHDVSRADYKAQLHMINQSIEKIDKKLDKLLDR